jgi:hypothetical protein
MHEGQVPTFVMPYGLAELMRTLEQTWPAHHARLRASGVPLNEETDEEKKAREEREAAEAAAKKKPWGDDADFDPEKAWKLITNLRSDADKLKGERDQLRAKVQEHEDASKSEHEKAAERAAAAETAAKTATTETLRLRIALSKGLTETQAKRLVGDTKEELEADADELVASFKPEDDNGGGGSGGSGVTRPKENLRTGAAPGAEPEETDPDKLAAQVSRPYR